MKRYPTTKPNSPSAELAMLAPFSAINFPKAAKSKALDARNLFTICSFFSVLPIFPLGTPDWFRPDLDQPDFGGKLWMNYFNRRKLSV
jgi:hypothetical protein